MREYGNILAAFPRPGRVLKAVLAILVGVAIVASVLEHFAGATGKSIVQLLLFDPSASFWRKPWAFVTSGFVTLGLSHTVWSALGLYFLTTDLERRWGGARLLRFLVLSFVLGNLAVLAGSFLPVGGAALHPALVYGPLAAIPATAIAWTHSNRNAQLRFLFFIPMTGKTLFWLTIGLAVASAVFGSQVQEGALAPIGGVAAGLLWSGSPSPARTAYLHMKLAFLKRRGAKLDIASLMEDKSGEKEAKARAAAARRAKGPPLRVVYGGLEDELKNRKPPKDKRFLN